MTDNELGVYLANLAATAASQAESIRELRVSSESQAESIRELRASVESQERTMIEGFESQARSMESLRESASYNTETVATALELSANILRAIDRSEQNIARLEQMLGIVINDGQADRSRITRLEDQNA